MQPGIFKSLGFRILIFYFLMSLIGLSFVISIIFENQVDLISKNIMLESEKKLFHLMGALNKLNIEISQGDLFNVKDEQEKLSHLAGAIGMHYKNFIIFSENNSEIYYSSPDISLPENFREDGLRSVTTVAFTGKNYYMRIDEESRVIRFYIPLEEFNMSGNILYIEEDIDILDESLMDLYKQAAYVTIVVVFFHLLFAVILYRLIIQPITVLKNSAQQLSQGNFSARTRFPDRNDEIGILAAAFNSMAESIHDNIKSLSSEIEKTRLIKEKSERILIRDEVTGLLNEHYFFERLDEELKHVKDTSKDISLAFINIDDFKRINEIFGKQTGDIVLLEISRIIKNCSPENGITARISGDEFAILSFESSSINLANIAEKIITLVKEKEIITPDGRLSVTASAGIAHISSDKPGLTGNQNSLFNSAKEALKNAKVKGKSRVEFNRVD
jgi:diguanylate cyclase (GGDEF)-like protein